MQSLNFLMLIFLIFTWKVKTDSYEKNASKNHDHVSKSLKYCREEVSNFYFVNYQPKGRKHNIVYDEDLRIPLKP